MEDKMIDVTGIMVLDEYSRLTTPLSEHSMLLSDLHRSIATALTIRDNYNSALENMSNLIKESGV